MRSSNFGEETGMNTQPAELSIVAGASCVYKRIEGDAIPPEFAEAFARQCDTQRQCDRPKVADDKCPESGTVPC